MKRAVASRLPTVTPRSRNGKTGRPRPRSCRLRLLLLTNLNLPTTRTSPGCKSAPRGQNSGPFSVPALEASSSAGGCFQWLSDRNLSVFTRLHKLACRDRDAIDSRCGSGVLMIQKHLDGGDAVARFGSFKIWFSSRWQVPTGLQIEGFYLLHDLSVKRIFDTVNEHGRGHVAHESPNYRCGPFRQLTRTMAELSEAVMKFAPMTGVVISHCASAHRNQNQ